MHKVLVNRLGGLSLPRKSVARLTDRPDMTLDVYRGRKTTIQQPRLRQVCDSIHYWSLYLLSVDSLGYTPGPGCSKLTTSLVNVLLNFQELISHICQYFLLKKYEKLLHCFSHFFNKKISVYLVIKLCIT